MRCMMVGHSDPKAETDPIVSDDGACPSTIPTAEQAPAGKAPADARPARAALLALLGYVFVPFSIRLSNTVLYPLFDAVMPLARDVNVGMGVAVSLLAVLAALHTPSLLRTKLLGAGAVASALAGSGAMAAGLALASPALLCSGAVLRSAGTTWVGLLASAACCGLATRWLLAGIPAASFAGYALAWGTAALPQEAALTLLALSPLAMYLCSRVSANPLVDETSSAPAQDGARLMRPASYLPLTNRMFVCMFLATAVLGFNLRLGPVEGGSSSPLASLATLAALAVLGWLGTRDGTRARLYDTIFRLAVVLAVAAFLIMPLASWLPLTQNLLTAAGACFDTVFVLVLIAAASRNRLSALTVLSWGSAMQTLGSIVGANLGAFVGASAGNSTAFLASGAAATALVAYVLLGLEGFSLSDTIAGIEPVQPLEVPQVSDAQRFEDACARVAQEGGLTPRETEVLALLARGRNSAYVQEELTLTRNTVKVYIKRIYAKLGVHSQQELIDLVEKG